MTIVTTLGVNGMTCSNCVAHVTKDLQAVDGVENVSVELRVGSTSEVTVMSHSALDEAMLRDAVDEAGYELTAVVVQEDGVAAEAAAQADEMQEAHNCACGCGSEGSAGSAGTTGAPAQKTYDLQVPKG